MNGAVALISRVLLTGVLLVASASAAAPQGPASSGDVKVVDNVVYEAIAARNGADLDKMLDDDFVLTNTFGAVYDKSGFLAACCTGEAVSKTQYLGTTDPRVKKYGDTAVITARTELRFSRENQDQKLAWRSIRVYVKSGGRWKLVAEQRTSIN